MATKYTITIGAVFSHPTIDGDVDGSYKPRLDSDLLRTEADRTIKSEIDVSEPYPRAIPE